MTEDLPAALYVVPLCAVIIGLLGAVLFQMRLIGQADARADRSEREKNSVIEMIDTLGERMTRKFELESTLETIVRFVVNACRAESGTIYLLDDITNRLRPGVLVGRFPPLFEDEEIKASPNRYLESKIRSHEIEPGEGIVGGALDLDQPLLIADAEADPRVPHMASTVAPLHSLMLCPLRVRGRNLGVLVVANKQGEDVFNSQDRLYLQALADQAAITVHLVKLYDVAGRQQKLEQELQVAHDFQRMLLPTALMQPEGYDIKAVNQPALTVGGDFYDVFSVDDEHVGIVIADVSGKGIPGALIMAMVRAGMRAEAKGRLSPREVLKVVNQRVLADTKDTVFVTMTYGILNTETGKLRVVRAGHEPVVVCRSRETLTIELVMPEGMAVGLMPAEIFEQTEETEIQLEPGDRILLYTDGVIEAFNPAREEYGRERLLDVLTRNSSAGSQQLLNRITAEIREFATDVPQHDDITLLTLHRKPGAEPAAARAE